VVKPSLFSERKPRLPRRLPSSKHFKKNSKREKMKENKREREEKCFKLRAVISRWCVF